MPTVVGICSVRTAHSISPRNEDQFEDMFMTTANYNSDSRSNSNNNSIENTAGSMDITLPSKPQLSTTKASAGMEILSEAERVPLTDLALSSSSTATPTSISPSTTLVNSLTVSSTPILDIESLVAQKQHQVTYIKKQQTLQQQKQRQLLYRHQLLHQQQQRQQEKEKKKQNQHQERQEGDGRYSNELRPYHCHRMQRKQEHSLGSSRCNRNVNHYIARDQEHITANPSTSDRNTSTVATTNSETSNISSIAASANATTTIINIDKKVDLVDDIWRLIFYVLAGDCKDLGRSMQVNRRFYSLIANDAVLWKLTYNLTVSGSIFATQKPLLSPTWIRAEQNHLACSTGEGSMGGSSQDTSSSESRSAQYHNLDMNEDGPSSAMLMNQSEPRHPKRNGSEGHAAESRRASVTVSPGLQLPSPLILPHHRRIAQNISTSNLTAHDGNSNQDNSENNAIESTGIQPIVDHSIDPQSSFISGMSPSLSSSSSSLNSSSSSPLTDCRATFGRTPASSPSSSCISSFQSTIPATISQVISSSTTPLSAIHNHIPTATLLHRHPAVYWKDQVVEWLEREKLRCLRLGLFWGFNAASSRAHRRRVKDCGGPDR